MKNWDFGAARIVVETLQQQYVERCAMAAFAYAVAQYQQLSHAHFFLPRSMPAIIPAATSPHTLRVMLWQH
jgi:hypothetical protein